MNPLFQNKPISTNLTGGRLSAPTQSVPGSGFLSSIGKFFSAPSSANTMSLTGGANAHPLIAPMPSSYTAPGFASALTPNIGLPTLPNTPSLSSQVRPTSSSIIPTAYASTVSSPITTPSAGTVAAQNQQIDPNADISTIPGLSGVASQLAQISQTISGLTPKSFSTASTNNVYDANKLSPGALKDLEDMRQAKENAMNSGDTSSTGGNTLVPSDSLMGKYVNQLYQASLYSPQELSAIQSYNDANQALLANKLAATRKVQQLTQNGAITQDQAASQIEDINRRFGYEAAFNQVQQTGAANAMDIFARQRGNTVDALKNIGGFIAPTQVSPGSTLYSPLGGSVYQGTGAAPATIASQAESMMQIAQQYGQLKMDANGQPDYPYYYQQASAFINGQQLPGQSGFGGATTIGSQQTNGFPQPGTPEFAASLPPAVYPALQTASTGATYFDGSKLDQTGVGVARQISKATGVPILDSQDAQAVKTTDQAIKNLKLLQANFEQLAHSSATGAIWSNFTDPISGVLQTSYGSALNTYNNNRDGLLQQIRALAGSSPRINSQELNLAVNALPTLTFANKDTIQTGRDKVNTVMGYLNNAMGTLVPGYGGLSKAGSGATLNPNGTKSGGVVQTKLGPINTNW